MKNNRMETLKNNGINTGRFFTLVVNETIPAGTKISQFRIPPSQNASIWTKIHWLLSNKIGLKQVDDLGMEDRGGFGSTGQ